MHESVHIKDSGHMEQMDRSIYEEFLIGVGSTTMGVPFSKKQGSNVEFHEYLGLLWLEYLFKIGHHDETFHSQDF